MNEQGSAKRHAAVWGARAEDWAEVQEDLVRPLYEAVLSRFEVTRGTRLLDAGCGAGGFLALARARGAQVAGIDATPELIGIARGRAPDVPIIEGELEELPYADATFDLVTGFNSFQYATRPVNALQQARRVTRAGGHVIVATWGRQEDCEAAGHLAALKPLLPPPPPGAGGPFALSDEATLKALVVGAGLTPLDVVDVCCPWIYADQAQALRGMMSSGPVVMAIKTSGEARVRAALLEAISPFRTAAGGYRLENKFRYVTARV